MKWKNHDEERSSRFSARRYALSEAMPQALRSNSKFKIQNTLRSIVNSPKTLILTIDN